MKCVCTISAAKESGFYKNVNQQVYKQASNTHLSIIHTLSTVVFLSNTFTIGMFVALALCRTIMTDPSKVASTNIGRYTVTMRITSLLTIRLTLVAKNKRITL